MDVKLRSPRLVDRLASSRYVDGRRDDGIKVRIPCDL